MTAPGVGPIVGLTYVGAIDDPARFSSSNTIRRQPSADPVQKHDPGSDKAQKGLTTAGALQKN